MEDRRLPDSRQPSDDLVCNSLSIEFLRHIDRKFVQRVTCYKVAHTEAVRIGVVARFSTSGRASSYW